MSERFDIVVAGGGLVGGVFANLAALEDLRVAVVDMAAPPAVNPADPAGARVVALSRGSERLLRRIDAWRHIAPERRGAYETMRIWDARGAVNGPDTLVFDCAGVGEPNLGHIIENDAVVAATWLAAQRLDNVIWLSGHQVSAIAPGDDRVRIQTSRGTSVSARLLVAADGARSACRDLMGIGVRRGAYAQEAVVSHLATTRPHRKTAYQRFLPAGPLALLPLADGRSSLVWSTGVAEAGRLMACDDDQFVERVTEASDGALGAVTSASTRMSFPLNWLHAREYCRPRFVMVGDAAHNVHPLAGQGVNLGLLDAAALIEVVADAGRRGRDPGDMAVLRRYERWRKSENGLMLAAFSGLNRLFGSSDDFVGSTRRLGMRYLNRIAPLKRELILRAMGVRGNVPASVRAGEGGA